MSAVPFLCIALPVVLLIAGFASIAGARGTLPRNHLFGIRIPSLLASDEAWAAGHRAAIWPSWIGFAITTVFAFVAWFEPPLWPQPFKYLLVVSFAASVVALFLQARRAAQGLAHAAGARLPL